MKRPSGEKRGRRTLRSNARVRTFSSPPDAGDPLAVGGPSGRTVCAEVGGDLREVRAFVFVVRGYDPNVRVKVAIGVGRAAVAGESEKMTIGRPGRLVVIVIA